MNHAYEIECIVEENRRAVLRLQDEYDEMKQRLSDRGGPELLAAIQEAEAQAEEERARQETEAREQREAVARSIAARRANRDVAPVDAEDEEAAFYQRKTWLI
ncbi:hypothetical protein [Nocardia brasiliensis]|uniref:hypothetical protein n=1 Tax=Nocardia brasiliensis TaxID=37326 RepID=UPI001892F7E3|nr:hypothetical protein [Nocardia brasiliensis]MBF6545086.1 hypothetical protein [Nocardia brasiliensis]